MADETAETRFPQPLSVAQQGAGLVAPAAAVALLGRAGAIAMLIVTYMVCFVILSGNKLSIN
jgi:hypothetical protein